MVGNATVDGIETDGEKMKIVDVKHSGIITCNMLYNIKFLIIIEMS